MTWAAVWVCWGLLLAQRQADLTLDGIELVAESAQLAVENLRENELRGR